MIIKTKVKIFNDRYIQEFTLSAICRALSNENVSSRIGNPIRKACQSSFQMGDKQWMLIDFLEGCSSLSRVTYLGLTITSDIWRDTSLYRIWTTIFRKLRFSKGHPSSVEREAYHMLIHPPKRHKTRHTKWTTYQYKAGQLASWGLYNWQISWMKFLC